MGGIGGRLLLGALLALAMGVAPAQGARPCKGKSCPAPTQPAPTEPAPTEPAPTEPAPTEPAPTGPVASPGEAPAPGITLALTAEENPFGLTPLSTAPSPDRQLWPDVRGHEPYGFNAYLESEDAFGPEVEAAAGRDAGASMARVGAPWAGVRYHASGWDYRRLDRIYRENVRRGLRPLWLLHSSPRRFTNHADTPPGSLQPGCGYDDFCANPPGDAALGDIGVFAMDLARRYPLSAGIEVWNEPNQSDPYWGLEPVDPCRYTRVLRAVHDGVKTSAPRMPLLGGALLNTSGGTGKMVPREFLAKMLGCGAGPAMDAVSFHPYSSPNNQSLAWNSQVLVDGFADAGVSPSTERFVATELGFATEAPHYTLDDSGQAEWLSWQLATYSYDWAGVPLSDRIDGAIVHTALVDSTPDRWNPWASSYGVVRRDAATGAMTPRPAFCKLRADFGGQPVCPASIVP